MNVRKLIVVLCSVVQFGRWILFNRVYSIDTAVIIFLGATSAGTSLISVYDGWRRLIEPTESALISKSTLTNLVEYLTD